MSTAPPPDTADSPDPLVKQNICPHILIAPDMMTVRSDIGALDGANTCYRRVASITTTADTGGQTPAVPRYVLPVSSKYPPPSPSRVPPVPSGAPTHHYSYNPLDVGHVGPLGSGLHAPPERDSRKEWHRMTRKDYELLARTLREDAAHLAVAGFDYYTADKWQQGAYDQWSTTVLAIAKALQTDGGFDLNGNRRFKIDKFLDAAGLSGKTVKPIR